jgi:hypothetical protein
MTIGDDKERLSLTFPDWPTYREFQTELIAVFASEGITDATVKQIGAATTGWEVDPNKPLTPWSRQMPAEFVVFSGQSLVQVMELDTPVDKTVVWQGRYVFLLNVAHEQNGFYDTSVGRKLAVLASRWSDRLREQTAQGFSFRLCLSDQQFEGPYTDGIVVMSA